MSAMPHAFFVSSFGRSGTVWLAKLLNGHPQVFCTHEGVLLRTHPLPWHEAGARETMQWLTAMRDVTAWSVGLNGYVAVGDANSIGGFHRTCAFDNELFRASSFAALRHVTEGAGTALLLREPILAIESKRRMLGTDHYRARFGAYSRGYLKAILEGSAYADSRWARAAASRDDIAIRVMLMLHWRWVVQCPSARTFRLEEIGGSEDAAIAAAATITGVPDGWGHVVDAVRRRENVSADAAPGRWEDVWRTWSADEQAAFGDVCTPWLVDHGYAAPASGRLHATIPLLDSSAALPGGETLADPPRRDQPLLKVRSPA